MRKRQNTKVFSVQSVANLAYKIMTQKSADQLKERGDDLSRAT